MRLCRATAGAVGILLCALVGLGPASATAAETATQPFTTAGEHAFTVPAGVTSLQVLAVGGHGGTGNGGATGGLGATATATLAVTPGETLYAEVGGDGEPVTETAFGVGGYGGGGGGGVVFTLFSGVPTAGGGGGASDVRTCPAGEPACSLASRLLVAAGGGGGAGGSSDGAVQVAGGPGGAAGIAGSTGTGDGLDSAGTGGGAASSGAGGPVGSGGANGSGGELGTGGDGGEAVFIGGGGGGGGGGIYGGGGGGAGGGNVEAKPPRGSGGGGGGGGSSGVPAGASGISGFSLLATEGGAEPHVTLTWTRPAPAVTTGAPSAITSTGATLTGAVNPDNSQITDCHFAVSNGASVPCIEQIGAGGAPVAVTAALGGLSPATAYTGTLVAASAQGSSGGSPVAFTTQSPGAASGGGALTVGALRVSPARFRRGHRAAAVLGRRLANATTISFTVSEAATATLTFERARPGVLAGRRCVAASHGHAKGRRCSRWARVAGGLTLTAHAGADRISFDGVLGGGARLTPGAYRVSLGARAGTAAARAVQHPTFTLLP